MEHSNSIDAAARFNEIVMKIRSSIIEACSIAVFFLLGAWLRIEHLEREAVEHFDEGIYASVLWYDDAFHSPYPAREFYAPPLLSKSIEISSVLPGLRDVAPFAPSVLMGALTVLALWWLARAWYGKAAGIFVAAVVALSDFHVLYSRMAMTDVPCLFLIIGAVYFGTRAIQTQSFSAAAISGFVCGLAWWTKYSGWLPLAIVSSGTSLWWMFRGRKSISAGRVLGLLGTILTVAIVTFSPWWWHLQSVGGYTAVAANHVSYMSGLASWSRTLATQLTYQLMLDGTWGAISLGAGMIAAGMYRWIAAECSTWNKLPAATAPESGAGHRTMVSALLLLRFMIAGVALTLITLRVWTPMMLMCISLGGFGGIFLWPVLQRSWSRSTIGDLSPTSEGSLPLCRQDLDSAATTDPALGYSTTLCWFVGMLITTPLYHPYSRLFFPLLASIWLGAAGGVAWWLESNVSVARRIAGNAEKLTQMSWSRSAVTVMLSVAVLGSFLRLDDANDLKFVEWHDVVHSPLGTDRSSMVSAAQELADTCVLSARGELMASRGHQTPIGETIRPMRVEQSSSDAAPRVTFTQDERSRERMVVYVFGEPALCLHLAAAGLTVVPVSHLDLGETNGASPVLPTFLVIGPNAKRTERFWEMWMQRVNAFEAVKNVPYFPSEVTLLDLFSPEWLSQHDEVATQIFELHRVK